MSDAFKPGSPTRRSARVHHEVMVGVTSEHGTFSGWGTNLSAGGVFVNSHHAPPIGTRVHVLLQLPGHNECKLTGRVARALRIVQPGAARVDAPYPIVDRCGGCPLQHVSYEAQLAAKQELTADALERIGGFARGSYELRPLVPSPRQFRYRRRAAMRYGGFAEAGTASVTPVDECLLFEPLLQEMASMVREAPEVRLLAGARSGAVDLRGLPRKRASGLLESR